MPQIEISDEVYDYIKKLIDHPVIRRKKSLLSSPTRFVKAAVSEYIIVIEKLIEEEESKSIIKRSS